MNNSSRLPLVLFGVYALLFVVLAIAPYNRSVWWVENVPIVAIAAGLAMLWWRGVRFSNLAYLLMSVLILMHTVGGHYTFERVPFDAVTHFFGFERNHYDRVAHFSVGFYAFAIVEYLLERKFVVARALAYMFGVFAIATIAAVYEIIEWIYAALEGGEAGAAFLGSQGDLWDAQKDMLADILGALVAVGIHGLTRRRPSAARG
jgi:putative membrane protein